MNKNSKSVCLVDAFSTGMELAKIFIVNGYKVVHVQTMLEVPKPAQKSYSKAIFEIVVNTNLMQLEEILLILQDLEVDIVIPASESGIHMADLIASKLGLSGNRPETSSLRRDKFQMNEAIKLAGLPALKQLASNKLEDLLSFAKSLSNWPIIVKPVSSAASENVSLCYCQDDITTSFYNIINKTDIFGAINSKVLIQEYVKGQKYIVNTASVGGKHIVTDLWKEDRTSENVFDKEYIVPLEKIDSKVVVEYAKMVLNAIELREGASHTEIILTDGNIPILIEVGARLAGNIIPLVITEAIGDAPVNILFNSYTNQLAFQKYFDEPYKIKKNIMVVNLIFNRSGYLTENNCIALLEPLPSFRILSSTPDIGAKIVKTKDLMTRGGYLYLIHEMMEQIHNDYNQIRNFERKNLLLVVEDTLRPIQ